MPSNIVTMLYNVFQFPCDKERKFLPRHCQYNPTLLANGYEGQCLRQLELMTGCSFRFEAKVKDLHREINIFKTTDWENDPQNIIT